MRERGSSSHSLVNETLAAWGCLAGVYVGGRWEKEQGTRDSDEGELDGVFGRVASGTVP